MQEDMHRLHMTATPVFNKETIACFGPDTGDDCMCTNKRASLNLP